MLFIRDLKLSPWKSSAFLDKLTVICFIVSVNRVTDILLCIIFSNLLLMLQKRSNNICEFNLFPTTLLNSLSGFKSLSIDYDGLSKKMIISSENNGSFIFSLSILTSLISFP